MRHPDGGLHLVWHQRRYLIRDPSRVLAALATTRARAVPVAPALLNSLPAGADLAPLALPDLGRRASGVPGATIGQVYLVRNSGGGRQYAVALDAGLAGITELQAGLLLARTGQGEPEPMTLGRLAALPTASDLAPNGPTAPPPAPPRLAAGGDGALCTRVGDDGGAGEVRWGVPLPDLAAVPRTAPVGGAVLADHVVVEPGRGAVVEAAAAPGASGGAVSVVTDLGRRYVLADRDVLAMLGYRNVRPCGCRRAWSAWCRPARPWTRPPRGPSPPPPDGRRTRGCRVGCQAAGRRRMVTAKGASSRHGRRSQVAKRCSRRSPAATTSASNAVSA